MPAADNVTDVAAEVINTATGIPQGYGLNPWFDWQVILGVPFWVFISCILVFFIAAVCVYWIAKIRKMNAVRGWLDSLNQMMPNGVQVWVLTRTLSLTIECLKIEDNVISYFDLTKIAMWHHNTRDSVIRVGGNPAVVVSEDFDQTRDFISEIALTDNCDEFNSNQERLKKEYKEKGHAATAIEPINNYEDYDAYGRETLQTLHPDGVPMKSYNIFNASRFLKYFPRGCSSMFYGGELTLDARNLVVRKQDAAGWGKYVLPIIIVIVGLLAIIAAWMVPL